MLSKEGFWWGRPATLIQDQSIPSNLDSEIHLLGFLRFNFEFHSPNAVTFSTVSARSGANRCPVPMSPIGGLCTHFGLRDPRRHLPLPDCTLRRTGL